MRRQMNGTRSSKMRLPAGGALGRISEAGVSASVDQHAFSVAASVHTMASPAAMAAYRTLNWQ